MSPEPSRSAQPQLVRAIGRWSMVALAVNSILGSGIFGLPSAVAGLIGRASPLAVLLAGAGMAVIVACYAEVASQFTETGGTYLYIRRAFGRLLGLQVGWLTLLSRLTACAAGVNLLVAYLGEFWPDATQPAARLVVITAFVGFLAAVNYRGVGAGTLMSNATVVAKLLALGAVCAAGVLWLSTHAAVSSPEVVPTADRWLQAMLLLLFAYGGYEAALNPMGEARDPRRDAAFALFVALGVLTALYCMLQFIVVGVLADPAHSQRPLADAARVIMGRPGAALIAVGALVSVYGYLSANMLTVPRGLFALAERGDFPAAFGAVHPRLRTPYVSIVVFALLVWAFAQFASFAWNVTLSAVARLFYYGAICVAVPVLRRRQPDAAALRLRGGLTLPIAGVAICALLLTQVDFSKSLILLATVGIGLLNWAMVRDRSATA
ncbi:MAG TPA: APC family permease [Steroidobacteraceae bacterium]|jgi:amino acid transporter|nr:APC family permease [Steroidobacteraceae bacterium]